jgi:hypothetical protein
MKITKHAQKRMRQRGFPDNAISILEQCGRHCPAPGGATKIVFGRKEYQSAVSGLKQQIQLLDHLKGSTIIMDEKQDTAITLYK